MTTVRRPWIAAVLSLLLPGLGHLYVGRPRAALVTGLSGFLAMALLYIGAAIIPIAPLNVALPLLIVPIVLVGVPVHAAMLARRSQSYTLRPYNQVFVYLGIYVVVTFLISPAVPDFLRKHLVEAFRIPSGAMEPTVKIGDFLYVIKWPEDRLRPALGGVVVFESVDEPSLKLIKRVLGLPGDTLVMRAGNLFRNGRAVTEPYIMHSDPSRSENPVQRARMKEWQSRYLLEASSGYAPDLQEWGPVIVPADSFFALGDNRDASYDSRYYGFVPFGNVIGQPSVIYFSFVPNGSGSLLSRVRWDRIGQRL